MARRRGRRALLKRVRDRMLRFFTCGHRRLDDDGSDSYLAKASCSASSQNGEFVEVSSLETKTQSQSLDANVFRATEATSGEHANTSLFESIGMEEPESSVTNQRKSPKLSRRRVSKWELDVKRDLQEVEDCSRIDFQTLVKRFEGGEKAAEKPGLEKLFKVDADVAKTDSTNHGETDTFEVNDDGESQFESLATEVVEMAAETAIEEVKTKEECIDEEAESMSNAAINSALIDPGAEEEVIANEAEGLVCCSLNNVVQEPEFAVSEDMITSEAAGLVGCALSNVVQEPEFAVTEDMIISEAAGLVGCALSNVVQEPEFAVTEDMITSEAAGLVGCALSNVVQEHEFAVTEDMITSEAAGLVGCALNNVVQESEFAVTEDMITLEAAGLVGCALSNIVQEPEFAVTEDMITLEAAGLVGCVLSNVVQEPEFAVTEDMITSEAAGLVCCALSNVVQEPEFAVTEDMITSEAEGSVGCVLGNVMQEANSIKIGNEQSVGKGEQNGIEMEEMEISGDDANPADEFANDMKAAKILSEDQASLDEQVIKIHHVDDKSTIDEVVNEDGARAGTAAVSTLSQIGGAQVVNRVTEVTGRQSFKRIASEASAKNSLVAKSLHAKISLLVNSEKRLDTETTPKNRGLAKIPSGKVESLIRKFSVHGN